MNQLKFVRSKSSARKNDLQYVHKPGKLDVSVGKRSNNAHVSTPKEKVEKMLQLLKTHKTNKMNLPLSHVNDYQNIYNKGYLDFPQSVEKSTTNAFLLKKFNQAEDQMSPTTTMFGTTMNSQFNCTKDILKQSLLINQQHHSEQKYAKQAKENVSNYSSHRQTPTYEEIVIDIYPQFIKQCQQKGQLKKIIVEEEEDHYNTKNSTKSPQRAQMYSEILTEKSLVLVSPKIVKDIELQTSLIKEPPTTCGTQCDTANVQVQTKMKKKNFGIFQYQLSYQSPQSNKNQKDIDLLSLEDFQSQILYRTQSEFEKDFSNLKQSQYKNTKQINDSRSYLLNQKSNIYMTKEQLLDPQDDAQPYYLQAEPKEINPNIYSINSAGSGSGSAVTKKKKESTSFSTYKEHLNVLMNSSANVRSSQNVPKKQPLQKSKSAKKVFKKNK